MKCWGSNSSGQLGDGTFVDRTSPVDVVGLSSGVVAVTNGLWHSCALMTGGEVKCWGFNFDGELGDGTTVSRSTPVDVVGLGAAVNISAGGARRTCAVTTNGAAKCWGENWGLLGDVGVNIPFNALPTQVSGLASGVARISVGWDHTCVLTNAGGVNAGD